MQVLLHGENSLAILENLWKGLYWILTTSLSPKDQRELFVPFSKHKLQLALSVERPYESKWICNFISIEVTL